VNVEKIWGFLKANFKYYSCFVYAFALIYVIDFIAAFGLLIQVFASLFIVGYFVCILAGMILGLLCFIKGEDYVEDKIFRVIVPMGWGFDLIYWLAKK